MQKAKEIISKINKKQKILLLIVLLVVACCVVTLTTQIVKQIQIKNIEGKPLLEWEMIEREGYKAKVLIKINSTKGIETIKYISTTTNKEIELNARGKITVGIDYDVEDQTDYEFKIKEKDTEEKTEILHFEVPRIKGNYTLKDGVYANKPDLTGYLSEYTRYLSYEEGNLIPKNWITDEEPENWYNYKQSMWANIYLETGGPEVYYTWIPRYCFKLDQQTQRSDVKFIDVYNSYKDEEGNTTTWKELEEQGYQVPEAFTFNDTELPGYWMMKYTLRRLFITINNKL